MRSVSDFSNMMKQEEKETRIWAEEERARFISLSSGHADWLAAITPASKHDGRMKCSRSIKNFSSSFNMTSKYNQLQDQRAQLPTFEYKQDLIDAIREYSILVIIGETGSGKTTQIPQYILEELPELKKVGVTQPRRIAAITGK